MNSFRYQCNVNSSENELQHGSTFHLANVQPIHSPVKILMFLILLASVLERTLSKRKVKEIDFLKRSRILNQNQQQHIQ